MPGFEDFQESAINIVLMIAIIAVVVGLNQIGVPMLIGLFLAVPIIAGVVSLVVFSIFNK